VTGDPSERIKTFPKNIQLAIADGRLIRGMTREQTLMSLGYPTADDVANLSSRTWLYWITDHVQYRVNFDGNDLVADIENVPDARSQILME
jgi:outer membrane protein assembly factor BamE (lipoprotein component of BamABCDE complex)